MAADPRQFTEHSVIGGVNVYHEDKRMEELKSATAKTAAQVSTTAQYIPLQDTDGNLVKINAASFQEAVRNVLGGLLANNDKGTTISGVPALSGSGANLDFGSVTPANLASVLGVIKNDGRVSTNINLDDYKDNTSFNYLGVLSGTGMPETSATTFGSVVVVASKFNGSKYCLQIIANNAGGAYIRHLWGNTTTWYTYKLSTL